MKGWWHVQKKIHAVESVIHGYLSIVNQKNIVHCASEPIENFIISSLCTHDINFFTNWSCHQMTTLSGLHLCICFLHELENKLSSWSLHFCYWSVTIHQCFIFKQYIVTNLFSLLHSSMTVISSIQSSPTKHKYWFPGMPLCLCRCSVAVVQWHAS